MWLRMITGAGLRPGWVAGLVLILFPSLAWSQCESVEENASTYRKTLLVTGFPFLQASHARLGEIANAEVKLPQMLANKINLQSEHLVLDASAMTVRSMERPQQGYASHFRQELADEYRLNLPDAQFVVSGVIIDAAETIERIDSFQSFLERQKAFFLEQKFHHPRRFELQVSVHNHYTGELVLKKHYSTTGNWDYRSTKKTGVHNPLFWRTGYGNKIMGVLELVANDIETAINCRPIMARINKVMGEGIVFAAMPQANLKTGDTLTLYKVDQKAEAALFNAGEGAKVTVVGINAHGVIAKFQDVNQWGIRVGDIVGAL